MIAADPSNAKPIYLPPPPSPMKESKRYRIVGSYSVDGFLHVYMEDSETRQFFEITPDQCTIDHNGPSCIHRGEVVTAHTGTRPARTPSISHDLADVVPTVGQS